MVSQNVKHYKFQAKPELADIIDEPVTFAVLRQILNFTCTDIITNNQSFVICYSNAPYPVWVWCKCPYDEKDTKLIADILKAEFLDKGDYRLIISEDLLQKLAKTHHVFAKMTENMQLFSYELQTILPINRTCCGHIQKATMEQVDQLTLLYRDASYEMEGHDFSIEHSKNVVEKFIQNDKLYLWVDDDNQIVATVGATIDGKFARVGFVYTLPHHRRKGYALNLVHGFSQILLDEGFTPILYTNGNYVASNECYKKIGYKQIGKLVDVEGMD